MAKWHSAGPKHMRFQGPSRRGLARRRKLKSRSSKLRLSSSRWSSRRIQAPGVLFGSCLAIRHFFESSKCRRGPTFSASPRCRKSRRGLLQLDRRRELSLRGADEVRNFGKKANSAEETPAKFSDAMRGLCHGFCPGPSPGRDAPRWVKPIPRIFECRPLSSQVPLRE